MFSCRENRIALMKSFESRKWRRSENFAGYFHDKILLGNKLQLNEPDLIDYVIKGFDNTVLQSQARIKRFLSLAELLTTMADRGLGRKAEAPYR